MPEITINLKDNNGETLKFLLEDFLGETKSEECFFDIRIMYVEKAGLLGYKHADYMILGSDFFKRYVGLHYNYESNHVAFSGRREPAHPFDPVPKVKSNVLAVILILVVPIVVSFFFQFLNWRNDKIKSELERYETLFGKEKKKENAF